MCTTDHTVYCLQSSTGTILLRQRLCLLSSVLAFLRGQIIEYQNTMKNLDTHEI